MKNNYNRLKWLAVVILVILLSFLAEPARAGVPSNISIEILQQEVRGVVTDTAGMPLPGVTVLIKGKNKGTTTDIEGKYSLIVEPGDILTFSFLGFIKLEEPVNGRREVWVELEEDISSLGEVQINAGYYNTTKRESTGNITRVTAEEIELQPVISPLQALQGRMAGVEIIPGGNQPGMASMIRIRGRNSLREDGNFPLYIIDGVPIVSTPLKSNSLLGATGIDPLNTLNLSNIQSIEILKDADATAIYGSRGANGVVLITTKKGQYQKPGMEARIYKGTATVPNKIDLLNTQQYLQLRRQAFENDGVEPTAANAYDLVLWNQDRYTDWQEYIFGGTSEITDINLATSGNNQNISYRLSGSYHKQGTVYLGAYDYNKFTAGVQLNYKSDDKKLNLDFSANYGIDVNNLVGNVDISSYIFRLPPNAPPVFNEDGSLHWEDWQNAGLTNPLAGYFNRSKTAANNLIANLGISYELFKNLRFKTTAGYTKLNNEELVRLPKRSYSPSSWNFREHQSSHLNSSRTSWIIEPQLNYNARIANGAINALIGGTFQESKSVSEGFQGEGYVSEALIGNISAAERIINPTNLNSEYRYNAIFARLGLEWRDRYFINLTGRRDGSSRFGPGKRIANFGAVGTAWIFSEEPFIKRSLSFLSFGKFRGSYGTTGNDQIGDYGYLDAYEATMGPGGLYPTQLANPNYSWEVNKKLEAALELGFLKDRFNLSVSWYRNRSSNQLVGYPLPSITGFTTIQANLPATVENTGWEIELYTSLMQFKNFRWQTSLNITLPKNELLSYPNLNQSSYANTYRVGEPLHINLLYQYDGLDPETGFYSVVDANEDGRFDYIDRTVVFNRGRESYGGINNRLIYKNLSLQFLWDFAMQDGTLHMFETGTLGNQRVEVGQALEGGDRYQRVSQSIGASRAYTNVLNSTFPIVDASFLRLRTLSFSYSLPNNVLQPLGVNEGKIYINGQNLLTLTNYEGMDPELPMGGISYGALKTVTAGVEINF